MLWPGPFRSGIIYPGVPRPRGFIDPVAAAALAGFAKVVVADETQVPIPHIIRVRPHPGDYVRCPCHGYIVSVMALTVNRGEGDALEM